MAIFDRQQRARALESRLVWIFGSPRSGSTWLLNLLSHPLAPSDDAPTGVMRLEAPDADPPQAIPINEPYAQQHLVPAVSDEVLASGRAFVTTLHEQRRSAPSYLLSDRYVDAWRPPLRQLVLARLAAQADAVRRAYSLPPTPLLIKEPNGSIGAEFVMSLLPASRMLFLLRDGRDVVDSMLDAQMPGGWLADPGADETSIRERRPELVVRESRLWLVRTEAVMRAYEAVDPSRRRRVRYEQAREDTAGSWASSRSGSASGAPNADAPTRCAGTTSTSSRRRPRGLASRCARLDPACGARTSTSASRRPCTRSWVVSWRRSTTSCRRPRSRPGACGRDAGVQPCRAQPRAGR